MKNPIVLAIISIVATSSTALAIPTTEWEGAKIPDWTQVSFSELPPIHKDGAFQSTAEIDNMAGYEMGRIWSQGNTPDEFLKLGDFSTSFKLQNFSIDEIASLTGIDLKSIVLEEFGTIADQSIEALASAIPELENMTIGSILPINDLLTATLGTTFNPDETIGELLTKSPMAGELKLGEIDLSAYDLESIPGITETPIGNFENWENSFIEEIPGLSEVPFSEFPGGIAGTGTDVGTADLILKNVEGNRTRTISGSDKEGFTVPCKENCAHIELNGSQKLAGRQWISGQFQEVQGGFGVLAQTNGGKEPTGIHPFGEGFKVVLWEVNDIENSVSTMLFFRVCKRGTPDLGCTPYFIGGVPFMTFDETMPMFLGKVEDLPASSTEKNDPKQSSNGLATNPEGSTFNLSDFTQQSGTTATINNDAMFAALSSIEGNYNSVGKWTCDNQGNCGRGLGAGQYMSYRPDVRSLISTKPGGAEFLTKIDSQKAVTGDELLLYFSLEDQHALFENDINNLANIASQQIDPITGLPFEGDRLIERVAQMHFGGISIPIDSNASDINGTYTVKSYGEQVRQVYRTYQP
jgi:hypothetical protein